MHFPSVRLGIAALGFTAICLLVALPAHATDFVQDQAGMFSASTVAQLNERISSFNAQTGKAIVVVTTPSLGGAALQSAAQSAFAQQNVNGVLVFIARDDRRDIIVPDRAGARAGWFTSDVLRDIRSAMEGQFKSQNFDAGITGAVSALLSIYRSHLGGLRQPAPAYAGGTSRQRMPVAGGVHIPMFWWIVIIVVGYLLLRSIFRAASGPRAYGPGAPPPGTSPAPPYGPGYGYGGYGGGGSFWSGLLGGLGGAWLGNELFRGGGGAIAPADAGQAPGDAGGGGGQNDSAGWQSDAGQADASGSSGGDWSGGGFGSDFGGGGDLGGGGGDSGGGW
jgi:uncharacterized membrane protein YgcG